jgi:hypothetical protein
VSACGHQFFYLARIDNFASSAAHNTPCAPALLEQLRELATLTYVHGKRSWRGERWGISKKEVTATQLGFYLLLLFLSPHPPPLSFPHPYPFLFKLRRRRRPDSVRPAHITINLSDKEKGSLSDEEKGGERLLWTRFFKGGSVTPPKRRRSGRPRRRMSRSG